MSTTTGVQAKVIMDSLSNSDTRLVTMEVRFHRFVLPELNTHRRFTRSSGSSRAIPVTKMMQSALLDPAMPLSWGSNRPGMQAGAELSDSEIEVCQAAWLQARDNAVNSVEQLHGLGLHKQTTNRLLEPFLWHSAVISSTEYENFFSQRCHPDAQPEIQALANAMRYAYQHSAPSRRNTHTPYTTLQEQQELPMSTLRAISVARCARVSYMTHGDTEPNVRKDVQLYRRLTSAVPPHWSPLEHVADSVTGFGTNLGNFDGDWLQLRHSFRTQKLVERELNANYPKDH